MRRLALVLAALALSACATAQKLGAANDVHALLISIRDNDSATFEAHVDHAALKAQMQTVIDSQMATNKKLQGIAALLGPKALDVADQLLVQPKTFRMVAEQYGYKSDTKIPGAI